MMTNRRCQIPLVMAQKLKSGNCARLLLSAAVAYLNRSATALAV
jgi:hypothetical protein